MPLNPQTIMGQQDRHSSYHQHRHDNRFRTRLRRKERGLAHEHHPALQTGEPKTAGHDSISEVSAGLEELVAEVQRILQGDVYRGELERFRQRLSGLKYRHPLYEVIVNNLQ